MAVVGAFGVGQRLDLAIGGEGRGGFVGGPALLDAVAEAMPHYPLGDEFEAILPGIEEESRLSELARRLIDRVSQPYKVDGHEIRIGTSRRQ